MCEFHIIVTMVITTNTIAVSCIFYYVMEFLLFIQYRKKPLANQEVVSESNQSAVSTAATLSWSSSILPPSSSIPSQIVESSTAQLSENKEATKAKTVHSAIITNATPFDNAIGSYIYQMENTFVQMSKYKKELKPVASA